MMAYAGRSVGQTAPISLMIITETSLHGAFVVELERYQDARGFFPRSWSQRGFAERGLDDRLVECDISYNLKRGTLRGLHYQSAPDAQVKLVRCTAGVIFDCIVDLRPESPTFARWIGMELSGENRVALYVPEGFAHGFQALSDGAEIRHEMSQSFIAGKRAGSAVGDVAFGIRWPEAVTVISDRDRASTRL